MKKDIRSEEDIKLLVDYFYTKAKSDAQIGYIFNDVVQLSWEEHLPTIYKFWDSILFGTATYRGNPMIKHIELNQKEPLTLSHFNKWIDLWNNAVNENFEGNKAEEAKTKAKSMKELMLFKIKQSENPNFIQ